ncbi:MAG: hypothetical protein H7A38_02810 [Chlamydiales bacterium]|nr:hypothetical protein [Chlamydiales bacterium]
METTPTNFQQSLSCFYQVNEWLGKHSIISYGVHGGCFSYRGRIYNVTAHPEKIPSYGSHEIHTLYFRIMNQENCYIYSITSDSKGHEAFTSCTKRSPSNAVFYSFLFNFIENAYPTDSWIPLKYEGPFEEDAIAQWNHQNILLPPNFRDYQFLKNTHPGLAMLLKETNLSQFGKRGVEVHNQKYHYTVWTEFHMIPLENGNLKQLVLTLRENFMEYKYIFSEDSAGKRSTLVPVGAEEDLHLKVLRSILSPGIRDHTLLESDYPTLANLLKKSNLSFLENTGITINFLGRTYSLWTEYKTMQKPQGEEKQLTLYLKVFHLEFEYIFKKDPSGHLSAQIPEGVETDLHLSLLKVISGELV